MDQMMDTQGAGAFSAPFGRRRFFVIGGASVGLAALIAACGEDTGETGIARVGAAPPTTPLPPADVNDVVLLRTAASIERTIIDLYDEVLAAGELATAETREYLTVLRANHFENAETFDAMTTARGGTPWTCANPRLMTVVVTPVMRAIRGGAATDTAAAVSPSDDPQRDVLSFAHGMESVATSSYQTLVGLLSEPQLRQGSIEVATRVARHAAGLALLITGTPEGYVSPEGAEEATGIATTTVAPTTTQNIAAVTTIGPGSAEAGPPSTPIPAVYAIPGQFGSLAPTPLVVGLPDAATGNRLSINLETPSLNTYVYEYMTDCPA